MIWGSLEGAESARFRRQAEILSAKERQALIGHLDGIDTDKVTVALTDRQKLALEQEKKLRQQGFSAFSSDSDTKLANKDDITLDGKIIFCPSWDLINLYKLKIVQNKI